MSKDIILLSPETVKTWFYNKAWAHYNQSSYKHKDMITGGWRDYCKYPEEAVIHLCMSFAKGCNWNMKSLIA